MTAALHSRLTLAACLPEDADRAVLIGRVWLPPAAGPALVRVTKDGVIDLSRLAPTSSGLLELDDPVAAIRAASSSGRIGSTAEILANSAAGETDDRLPSFLAPCDLQAIKASGVTFVSSMIAIPFRAKLDFGRLRARREGLYARAIGIGITT